MSHSCNNANIREKIMFLIRRLDAVITSSAEPISNLKEKLAAKENIVKATENRLESIRIVK